LYENIAFVRKVNLTILYFSFQTDLINGAEDGIQENGERKISLGQSKYDTVKATYCNQWLMLSAA